MSNPPLADPAPANSGPSGLTTLLLILLLIPWTALADGRQPRALELLEKARAAALAIDTVAYGFEAGGPGNATGWVEGEVRMRRGSGYDDAWILVRGLVEEMPGSPARGAAFAYATDGRRAFALDGAARKLTSAKLAGQPGAVTQQLIGYAAWGILRELVDEKPYWMELESAEVLELLGRQSFAGVSCDVLRAVFDHTKGKMEVLWYLGSEDHLPRGQAWSNAAVGASADFPFVMRDLETGVELDRESFVVRAPEGYEAVYSDVPNARIGAQAPDWKHTTHNGETLSLEKLRGKVVVMDFWTTSCYFCHNMMPGIQQLHEEFRGRDVEILGFNIWEQGDPAAYWNERGFTYPFLPSSDEIADLYGIAAQPSVVVVGRDGRVVYSRFGAGADRTAGIRAAIRSALGPGESR